MMYLHKISRVCSSISLIILTLASLVHSDEPNLIVIMTDEHNLRTLGCYRDLMERSQAFVWGNGIKVDTPHLDSLARDGALFTNFNVVAPLCTPSRASFMTGLYPAFTGAIENHTPMDSTAVTFAELLQQKKGYSTGYIGKWHLNGRVKPGFENEYRKFGFYDTKYQFNRGHWKFFEDDGSNVHAYEYKDRAKVKELSQDKNDLEAAYATDFLFRKALEFMSKRIRLNRKFALMLSIPDPHGPNLVRAPYDTMFNSMNFTLPATAVAVYNKNPAIPGWAAFGIDHKNAEELITSIENDEMFQTNLRNYFGMVKLIDDKIGELLQFLEDQGQVENTIVVFTSDHGDMMGEHGKFDKGKPYKTSAGVPFLIRYPNYIKKGKIVKTAYTSPDFVPTILSLMGIDYSDVNFQGIDGSDELLDNANYNYRKQVRFMTDSKQAKWAAAVDREYKLVLSSTHPYLFDLKNDPDELVNFHGNETYKDIVHTLEAELFVAMKRYKFSLADKQIIFFDRPVCKDSKDQIPSFPRRFCEDLQKKGHEKKCQWDEVRDMCPSACGCCKDTRGEVRYNGNLITCSDVAVSKWNHCNNGRIVEFCPVTCAKCIPEPSARPSSTPSRSPTFAPSTSPSASPSTTPSYSPTLEPSLIPSRSPSTSPSAAPSYIPTLEPSLIPSRSPSTSPSVAPSYIPSNEPSLIPSRNPSTSPSAAPSYKPTIAPSSIPTVVSSIRPSADPSYIPTNEISSIPSMDPTVVSSTRPSASPSTVPPSSSVAPSHYQTIEPSLIPSKHKTSLPTAKPSLYSSDYPSYMPTNESSLIPSKPLSISPSRPNTIKSPLIECVDDSTFYVDFEERTCAWINRVQTRKESQCKTPEVRFACPSSCGICCKDDVDYIFYLSHSNIFSSRNCAWLKEKDGHVEELCNVSTGGRLIKEGCPQTCNNCNIP